MTLPLEAIEELPPETTGALTFHLPLEVAALELAGAPPEVIEARITARLAEAYVVGLVDPPFYRWAVEHYRGPARRLSSEDAPTRAAALSAIEPLAAGLAGAAFHGLIRLGYGLWRERPGEVARGLAYLRCRRQVLVRPGRIRRTEPTDYDTPLRRSLPTAEELVGSTVFDQMNLAAGTSEAGELLAGDAPLTIATMVAAATGLLRRNPSSFVAVHTVTGLQALCELQQAVEGSLEPHRPIRDLDLRQWWGAYGVALGTAGALVAILEPETVAELRQPVRTRDQLVTAAVHSGETHDVKVVVALGRLCELGALAPHVELELGRIKLAATECAHH